MFCEIIQCISCFPSFSLDTWWIAQQVADTKYPSKIQPRKINCGKKTKHDDNR